MSEFCADLLAQLGMIIDQNLFHFLTNEPNGGFINIAKMFLLEYVLLLFIYKRISVKLKAVRYSWVSHMPKCSCGV